IPSGEPVTSHITAIPINSSSYYSSSNSIVDTAVPPSTITSHVPTPVQAKIYQPPTPRIRSRHESRCNEIMEEYYGRPFASIWHPQIINPHTNYLLELDCYNEELQLAVEYNGIQHYQWPNYTNVSKYEFDLQVGRDAYKRKRCAE